MGKKKAPWFQERCSIGPPLEGTIRESSRLASLDFLRLAMAYEADASALKKTSPIATKYVETVLRAHMDFVRQDFAKIERVRVRTMFLELADIYRPACRKASPLKECNARVGQFAERWRPTLALTPREVETLFLRPNDFRRGDEVRGPKALAKLKLGLVLGKHERTLDHLESKKGSKSSEEMLPVGLQGLHFVDLEAYRAFAGIGVPV